MHHADFHRRIVHCMCDLWLAQLLLIAKRGRHVQCVDRLRVAKILLDTDDNLLEITARKLKNQFALDLEKVVETNGQCPGLLWLQVAIWCDAMPSDIGYIEGINNKIIQAVVSAPSIQLPLLSSRVVSSCDLLPAGVNHRKVADMQEPMNTAVRRACDSFAMGQEIMDDLCRFATPGPLQAAVIPPTPCAPCAFSKTAMMWGRHYNAKWISHARKCNGFLLRALLVVPTPGGNDTVAYLMPHIHGWSGHLVECHVPKFEQGVLATTAHPLRYKQSEILFAELYESRALALPFSAGTMVSNAGLNVLQDEQLLGRLEHWVHPEPKKNAIKDAGSVHLAIQDGSVHELTEDDTHDVAEAEDHDGDGKRLDDETGVCQPDVLSKAETDYLANEQIMKAVEAKLDGGDFGDAHMHDPNSLLKDLMEEVMAEAPGIILDLPEMLIITQELCEAAVNTWDLAFRSSFQAAREAEKQHSRSVPATTGNASLMVYSRGDAYAVSFVHWPNSKVRGAGVLKGRQVLVRNGKFVYSIPALFSQITFKTKKHQHGVDFKVIIADVGARMMKVRKPERPSVPNNSLRMKDMCEIALGLKTDDPAVGGPMVGTRPCFVCNSLAHPLRSCAVCTLSAHEACLDQVLSWSGEHKPIAHQVLEVPRTIFFGLFKYTHCQICTHSELIGFF